MKREMASCSVCVVAPPTLPSTGNQLKIMRRRQTSLSHTDSTRAFLQKQLVDSEGLSFFLNDGRFYFYFYLYIGQQ